MPQQLARREQVALPRGVEPLDRAAQIDQRAEISEPESNSPFFIVLTGRSSMRFETLAERSISFVPIE